MNPKGEGTRAPLNRSIGCSAMISLLSQMSGLYEAPEDIFNARIIAFAPKGLTETSRFAFGEHSPLLSDNRNESIAALSDEPSARHSYVYAHHG